MTDAPTDRPEWDTASAAEFPPRRDFDGGLLNRIGFQMTRADALAYLRLKRELTGREKLGLWAWIMGSGALSGFVLTDFAGPPDEPKFIAIFLVYLALMLGLLLGLRDLWRRLRARAMVPHAHPAVFEEWIDCVAGTIMGKNEEDYLSPELIGQVVETPSHIFVLSFGSVLVLPTRALPDAQAKAALADHLRSLARGPYYFDA
ncbi:MAG: hypothetical protein ACOH2M_11145 [Cypionkella sp.]